MTSKRVHPAPLFQSIGILLIMVGVFAYVMGRLPFFEAAEYWATLDNYSLSVLVLGVICIGLWAVLRRR
jgi:membrane protein DedA with SNARE-associated domain